MRLHPGAWILWATCAGMITFTTTNPLYLGMIVAVCYLVYATQRVEGPGARAFKIFVIAAVLAVTIRTSLVIFTWPVTMNEFIYQAYQGMRLGVMLVVFGTFNSVTDPYGVLRLAPSRFHEPALAAALALSMAPRTIIAAGRVREAQRLRGIRVERWRSLPALAIPVLETGMEEAVTLAESMDARGHGRGKRTRYRPQPWTGLAVLMGGAALLAMMVFMADALFLRAGDLQPGTDPLMIPAVAPLLLAAIMLLAVPAFLPRPSEPA